MTIDPNSSRFYADIHQLQQLKAPGNINSKQSLEQVAKEFESIYLKMMLDSMRAAEKLWAEDNPFHSKEASFYRDMLDSQLSQDIAQSKSIGLADVIVQQLSPYVDQDETEKAPANGMQQALIQMNASHVTDTPVHSSEVKVSLEQGAPRVPVDFKSIPMAKPTPVYESSWKGNPDLFIQKLMPVAEKAAKTLGVDPKLLIAQSALETGWGKSLGQSSENNLFGIKANSQWQGKQNQASTQEYIQGRWLRVEENFRAYDDIEASFQDYVGLIQNSSRYREAVASAEQPQQYLLALQKAGYATDPEYAEKVMAVYTSQRMQTVSEQAVSQQQAMPEQKRTEVAHFDSRISEPHIAAQDPRLNIW